MQADWWVSERRDGRINGCEHIEGNQRDTVVEKRREPSRTPFPDGTAAILDLKIILLKLLFKKLSFFLKFKCFGSNFKL